VQPPVSLVLAARAKDYIHALTTFRFDGDLDSPEAHEGANTLVATVAAACSRSVDDAVAFEDQCAEMTGEWRSRLERVRAGSALDLLLTLLPGTPIVTVRSAMELTGRSKPQVNAAVARLVDAGILKQVTAGRRNRAFEATDVIDAFGDLERILASPSGGTT
jgi:Fic family protein